MTGLESRLKQIEDKLKLQMGVWKEEPLYIDLLDLPKETVIDTFDVLKEATGGYQCMVSQDEKTAAGQDELNALDLLSPEQYYDLLVSQRAQEIEGTGK